MSERDPLLNSPQNGGIDGTIGTDAKRKNKVGPLEISKSTRYGILAGIWTATFLSVCTCFVVALALCSLSYFTLYNSVMHEVIE